MCTTRNVFSAAMAENLGFHCCLGSAFLPALCWSWYVSSLSSTPFLRTLLKKLHLSFQKMKCLPLSQTEKKRGGEGRKHISPQTLPSSSYVVSDSHLAEICSTPSVLRSSLYTKKGIWPKLLVNMKQSNGIVTVFQHELIFSGFFILRHWPFYISLSERKEYNHVLAVSACLWFICGSKFCQKASVILLPGFTFCLWCTNYRGVTEHLFPIINQGCYPGMKFCSSHERM